MRQRNLPDRTESFAARPDSSPAPDVLSTALRAVRLAGHTVSETEAEPARAWTATAMASLAHMSRTTFIERFTQLLGQPPVAYLGDLRMELARDLLVATTDSVKQVAHRVGYASDAAFNRAFARHHGRTPAQWRTDRAAHGSHGRGAAETDSVQ
jgi:AraC-like DNA-binding protein